MKQITKWYIAKTIAIAFFVLAVAGAVFAFIKAYGTREFLVGGGVAVGAVAVCVGILLLANWVADTLEGGKP